MIKDITKTNAWRNLKNRIHRQSTTQLTSAFQNDINKELLSCIELLEQQITELNDRLNKEDGSHDGGTTTIGCG